MDYGCPTVVLESPAPYHIFISAISIIVFTYIQVKRIMTKEGAPLRASMYATVQVINAGDGGHNHPTQTLIDFMTIRQRKGHLDHLNEFYFISLEELRIPDYVIEETLKPNHIFYKEVISLEETISAWR